MEGAPGETATLRFVVSLDPAPGRFVTVDWAADANPGTASSRADYRAFSGGTLTFPPFQSGASIELSVTGDALDEPDETIRIALSNPSGAVLGSASVGVGTITDDDPTPTLALALELRHTTQQTSTARIREGAGGDSLTVTASLRGGTSGEAITVTVQAASIYAALAADGGFSLSTARTLTIAAGRTTSAGVVTITATDDAIYSADLYGFQKRVRVSGAVAGGHGLVAAPTDLTLTILDDDSQPSSALALAPASISESAGVATVTATLSHPSAHATTIVVSATASTGAVAGDFSLSTAATLTVAAGRTTSAGLVTVTAVGNGTDSPDKQVTVEGDARGGLGASDPPDATLTLRDDDGPPTVSLVLSSSSVSESGGVATVTAALGGASSAAVTVTVSAAAVAASGAVAGDFSLSGDTTLTIAANATTSTGVVTITAGDNDVDSPDKSVTVSGTATGGNGVVNPPAVTLTLADDETLPTVALALSDTSISEAGGVTTVTATLSHPSSEAAAVTVLRALLDVTSTARTLTIAAGSTVSTGTVTVTPRNNYKDEPDWVTSVSGRVWWGGPLNIGSLSPLTHTYLTVTDDDTAGISVSPATSPTSRLRTTESADTATFTVKLDSLPATRVALDVASTDTTEGTVAPATLTFTNEDWSTAQTVTLTGVADAAADGNQDYTVTLTIDQAATLDRIYDAFSPVTVYASNRDNAFGLDVGAVSGQATEGGGRSTFTVALLTRPSAAVTVAVSSLDTGEGTVSPSTLTFAPSAWNTAQTVTVRGVQDNVDDGTVTWQVRLDPSSGDAGYNGLPDVDVPVSTTDDDLTLTLSLNPSGRSHIWENPRYGRNVATVTARLSRRVLEAVTVTVSAASGAAVDDFSLSEERTLTIAAWRRESTGLVTITATDDATYSRNTAVRVGGTVAGGHGRVVAPADQFLTIFDDEQRPTSALALAPASVSESAGVATVTATLSHPSANAVTIAVSATASTGAVAGDFSLSTANTLTVAPGRTTSAGLVTVTAVGNGTDSPDKQVTVKGSTWEVWARDPPDATLTLRDDDGPPTVSLVLSSSSIAENGGVATVSAALGGASSAAVTVTVSAAAVAASGAVAGDFSLSGERTLTIAAGETTSAGTVTVTANDNDVDSPNRSVTVSGTVAGGNGVAAPPNVTLTLRDDDPLPKVALALSDTSISEAGGVTTVTATLSHPSSEAAAVTVLRALLDVTSTARTLIIAAGSTVSTGTVTLTARDDDFAQGDFVTAVSGRVWWGGAA